jgi:hypothetical protein
MRELTLDEIGVLLVKAVRKLSVDERKRLAAAFLENIKRPVGKLGTEK